MRTVKLYGELGKKYGKVHHLHVESVGEAVRLLSANFPDFRQHIIDNNTIAGYEVWDGKYNLGSADKELFCKQGNSDIKIIPRVVVAGNAAKIITGAVLIAASWWAGGAAGWGFIGSSEFVGANIAFNFGMSLVFSGVLGMMTKTAAGTTTDSDDTSTQSYIFSGVTNTTKQGNPVPLVYGKHLLGSQVISASLTTGDIPI